MRRRVLVVAAEDFELRWIREFTRARENAEYVMVANGPGPKLAGEAVDGAGPLAGFDAYVSVGLCGALIEGLQVGAVVLGRSVNGIEVEEPRCGRGYTSGPIASVDYVAGSIGQKRSLRETGAIAVEMEAAAVLERARRVARPFYCIKTVSDTLDEEFVIDLNAARDGNGRFRVMRILGQAARQPMTAVPELVKLKRRAEAAGKALGEFFASCNF
jgi:purine-nucleoside phosphorylase